MNKVKISILVPVYNAQFFLHETVASVLSQTYTDFELILINDGSTDDSLAILEKIKETDSRIKVLTQVNKGVTAARKLGWSFAAGEYITFLDADDSFYPNSLEVLINELNEDYYDIVNGSFVSVPSGRKWIHDDIVVMNSKEYFESIIFSRTFLPIYASLYKKSLFRETSFEFDCSLKIGEDVLMNLEIGSRISKVKNIRTIVYKYTDNNEKSAMTIIERHPNYYKRFFQIRDGLYRSYNDEIFKKHQQIINQQNNLIIINSLFSPHINFNRSLYFEIQNFRTNVRYHNFYTICLINYEIAFTVKVGIKIIYYLKCIVKNRIVEKVILK